MPQGIVKRSQANRPHAKSEKKAGLKPGAKKGARSIAPKRKALLDQHKKVKKFNATMTRGTERSLAEKAGKMRMIGKQEPKGKKNSKTDGQP